MRDYRQRTVIVAVIAVRMMEASVDQVIKVVPMRNRLMAAVRTMAMRLIMSGSTMLRVAPIGIRGANFNHVFISVPLFHMLQVAMVEVINLILMLNGNMAAARTMHMRLIGRGHDASFSECRISFARQKIGNDSDEIEDARNRQLGAFRRAGRSAFPGNQSHLMEFAVRSHPPLRPVGVRCTSDVDAGSRTTDLRCRRHVRF